MISLLKKKRKITTGPGLTQWVIAAIDSFKVIKMTIRGLRSNCSCDLQNFCSQCSKGEKVAMNIIGVLDDKLGGGHLFWGFITILKDEDLLRTITNKWDEPVAGYPDRVQLVYGVYSPTSNDRGWIAPCQLNILELSDKIIEVMSLRSPKS